VDREWGVPGPGGGGGWLSASCWAPTIGHQKAPVPAACDFPRPPHKEEKDCLRGPCSWAWCGSPSPGSAAGSRRPRCGLRAPRVTARPPPRSRSHGPAGRQVDPGWGQALTGLLRCGRCAMTIKRGAEPNVGGGGRCDNPNERMNHHTNHRSFRSPCNSLLTSTLQKSAESIFSGVLQVVKRTKIPRG